MPHKPFSAQNYPRDLRGYGQHPPHPRWPQEARIAVQLVVNYEEGGENCILHGDEASEKFLSEIVGAAAYPGVRHPSMESIYEYGSRAGVWRLLRALEKRGVPCTMFAVGMAIERHPDPVLAYKEAGHEIASHGYRWIDYQFVDPAVENEHIHRAISVHQEILGETPQGFYQGRTSPQSRELCVNAGTFLYDADSYADDLPYWDTSFEKPHLIVPYTLDTNDMRFATQQGFNSGTQFYDYLKDAFDVLYAEGEHAPKMLSIGLHCRLAGRPARIAALERFLDYIQRKEKVWICRRVDIAHHWVQNHYPDGGGGK